MSYRAFKRLLGETSLERKCRWLLGAGVLLLMTGSFWVYAGQTEGLAYDQLAATGRALMPAILARSHAHGEQREVFDAFAKMTESHWPAPQKEYSFRLIVPGSNDPEHQPAGDDVAFLNTFRAEGGKVEDSRQALKEHAFYYYGAVR